ncbi:phage tail protein [Cupriavidus basilensis]|uniref:phage tail protein n=1 Tax=Cupriavidus basilensis TaxID=68895 RepID=UPI0039F6D4FB
MAVRLPNGAIFSIASVMAASIAVTGISNAAPPVASAAGHTLLDGDIIRVVSGWPNLNDRVARVDSKAAGTFELEGFDTTDLKRYPAGAGAGNVVKASSWVAITQVLESNASGGEQQFYNYSFLEDTGDERQIPTTRSARSMSLTLADDDTLPHYAVLSKADADREPRVIRLQFPNGTVLYFLAYVSFSKVPSTTKNQAMALSVTLSLVGEPSRYAGDQV